MKGGEQGARPWVSVVVPVYNEEENLPVLLREIRETLDPLGRPYEVVFVDDGSRDRSLEVLKGLLPENPMVRVVVFEKNAGQTAAMDAGLRAARGEILVTLDADLQNDPHDIPLLLQEIGRFDVVVGYRAVRQDSLVKRITSKVGNGARNWLTKEQIRDTGCSLKAFRREAVARLKLFKGMHRFLPTLCKMEGFTVTEVKVNHRPRVHGKTKYGVFDRLRATVPDVLAVRWMQKRVLGYRVKEELP
ncbi:MAG: glycosyltransferase family 2 protein [Acidobacteriota bacterium]